MIPQHKYSRLLVASPFFLLNCMGFLSHPHCSLCIAGATLFYFRGAKTCRVSDFVLMSVLIGCSILIRPLTGLAAGMVLGPAAMWKLRSQPGRLLIVAGIGTLALAGSVGGWLFYNHQLTGTYQRSPYAVYMNPAPVNADDSQSADHAGRSPSHGTTSRMRLILRNCVTLTRWSMESTTLTAFPFVFLLAAYALIQERERRGNVYVLAGLFAAVVICYLIQTAPSDSAIGERYYFEPFFAVAVLAARGWSRLRLRWKPSGQAVMAIVLPLSVIQVIHYAVFTDLALARVRPSRRVQALTRDLQIGNSSVVFMRAENTTTYLKNRLGITIAGFTFENYNENAADWRNASIFYAVDPGPSRRPSMACALKRTRWGVVVYDAARNSVRWEDPDWMLTRERVTFQCEE